MLKKLKIQNIKGIKDIDLTLENINQITGNNGEGKSSINEALRFLMEGSGRDKKIIREGQDTASVFGLLQVDGNKVEVKRTISNKGCSLDFKVNGEGRKNATNELLRKFFGVASFNPAQILEPDNRNALLNKFIKDDFKVPEEIKQFSEAADELLPDERDLDKNKPIECLLKYKKGLENYRLQVGRDKKSAKAVADEDTEELKDKNFKLMKIGIDETEIRSKEDILKEKAGYDAKIQKQAVVKEDIKYQNRKVEEHNSDIEKLNEQLAKIREQIATKKSELEGSKNKIKELTQQVQDVASAPERLLKELQASDLKEEITTLKKRAEEKGKAFKAKEKEYATINKFLSEEFDKLYAPYIKSVKEKIEGFDFYDGHYRYNGNRIEDLSSGEAMSLAIKMIEAQQLSSNVVCIDNAECIDEENLKKFNLSRQGTNYIILKVGDAFPIQSNNIDLSQEKKKQEKPNEILDNIL